jgi:uncharacterized cupin superfamily protein
MSTSDDLRAKLVRNWNDAELRTESRAPHYDGARFGRLAPGTAAKKLGASIDIIPPGKRGCPYHFHYAQEEMFVVIDGEGTLRVAGEMVPIRAGDVIFIPPGPDYPHQILNTSERPLTYLSVSTQEKPEVVEYPDSGKYLALAERDGKPNGFARMHREKDDLEYWDGEP